MITKVQLFDASRCINTFCKHCSMDGDMPMNCIETLANTAIELIKENEELKEKIWMFENKDNYPIT